MSMKYIRDHYGVPAKRGMRICFSGGQDGQGRHGTIVGAMRQYLRVRFDLYPTVVRNLHPTWEVEYLTEPTDTSEGEK